MQALLAHFGKCKSVMFSDEIQVVLEHNSNTYMS